VIGGTSAVAPLWAGLLARINQSIGKPAGYLNPLIYSLAAEKTFRDITSGTNGGYSAPPAGTPAPAWAPPTAPPSSPPSKALSASATSFKDPSKPSTYCR